MRPSVVSPIVLAAMAGLGSSPVHAAAPQLSGAYLMTVSTLCQASLSGLTSDPGEITQTVAVANFSPSHGTVAMIGFSDDGDLSSVGAAGKPITQSPLNQTVGFSNSATTLTINGKSLKVFYGDVARGVAQTAVAIGVVEPGCTESITLIHR